MASSPPKICRAIFIGIALLALVVRLPRLGERPMHTDEAVNAYIVGQLLEGAPYQYDPRDRHGPALYALALPIARLADGNSFSKLTESALRLGPVLVGAATILLLGGLTRRLGLTAATVAALLLAIGPLPVYYNRYFIHETLFVAATFGCILSAWSLLAVHCRADGAKDTIASKGRISGKLHPGLGALTGLCAGIMLACKETALIHFAALGVASLCWFLTARDNPEGRSDQVALRRALPAIVAALLTFLAVIIVAFTWAGAHWGGLHDLIKSIPHLTSRAAGEGHEKSFWYYFALLGGHWSGGVVMALGLLGAAGAARQVWGRPLLIYTVLILALYSFIPYKTPWLALNLWLPLSLLAGCGAALLWQRTHGVALQGFLVCAAIGLIALLGKDTWQRAYVNPSDPHNPYAYAHTGDDLLRLPDYIGTLQRAKSNLSIAVVAADPWPLPWYLRHFQQVGFWQPGQDPGPAEVYITSPEAAASLAPRLQNRRPEFFGLRPEVLVTVWMPPEAEARHE